jgi:hypothetical protein
MKITIKRSGGFAGPLNDKTFALETAELPRALARRIESFLSAVAAAPMGGRPTRAKPGADRLKFDLEIDSPEGKTRLCLDESAVPRKHRSAWEKILGLMDP